MADLRIFLRPVFAFILGTLAPAAMIFALFATMKGSQLQGAFFIACLAAFVASAGVMVIGLPMHAFLQNKNWTGYRHYIAAGFTAGLALSLLAALDHNKDYWIGVAGLCLLSVTSAMAFRFGWGNP